MYINLNKYNNGNIYNVLYEKTPTYTLQQYAEQMGYFDSYRDIKIIYFDNYNF